MPHKLWVMLCENECAAGVCVTAAAVAAAADDDAAAALPSSPPTGQITA